MSKLIVQSDGNFQNKKKKEILNIDNLIAG